MREELRRPARPSRSRWAAPLVALVLGCATAAPPWDAMIGWSGREIWLSDTEAAIRELHQGLRELDAMERPDARGLVYILTALSWLCRHTGEPERAVPFAERALREAEATSPAWTEVLVLPAAAELGEARIEAGDIEGGRSACELAAAQTDTDFWGPMYVPYTPLVCAARFVAREGRLEEAASALIAAAEGRAAKAFHLQYSTVVADVQLELARVRVAQGRRDEAAALAREAIATYRARNDRYEAARTLLHFQELPGVVADPAEIAAAQRELAAIPSCVEG